MTRVSVLLEKKYYRLDAWEEASPAVKQIAQSVTIAVQQGSNINYADLTIQSESMGFLLTCSLCDLWQEKSPMIDSIKSTIVEDTSDEDFDYWDALPPFGIVHLYDSGLIMRQPIMEEDLEDLFNLFGQFLLKHFMMYVMEEHEAVCPYMMESGGITKTYVHEGLNYYRNRNY
ncbi:hypothetical protein [Paenibacillus glycanilyticus]|uniref:Uncharacterized protein n=1 Tax=Paenibacillus glycanilyticus TaxID=126569 RepID=A0ABQ6GAR2_9BACL|nr:hypothetical protein [Paenibacillus glycanilyticus]GLX66752.1 hypothetical protein MU1_10960 [Paenibacillus glycanilyticus]